MQIILEKTMWAQFIKPGFAINRQSGYQQAEWSLSESCVLAGDADPLAKYTAQTYKAGWKLMA